MSITSLLAVACLHLFCIPIDGLAQGAFDRRPLARLRSRSGPGSCCARSIAHGGGARAPGGLLRADSPRALIPAGAESAEPWQRLPPVDEVSQVAYIQPGQPAAAADDSSENRFGMLGLAFQDYVDRQKNPLGFPKGKPLLVIGGQVQADAVYFGQDAVSQQSVGDLQDSADFRRARLVLQGVSHDVYRYVFGVDFALAGRPSFLDMYIEHIDLPLLQNVRVGHFFEPFSLERVTQNRNNTFMERSLVDTFAPAQPGRDDIRLPGRRVRDMADRHLSHWQQRLWKRFVRQRTGTHPARHLSARLGRAERRPPLRALGRRLQFSRHVSRPGAVQKLA